MVFSDGDSYAVMKAAVPHMKFHGRNPPVVTKYLQGFLSEVNSTCCCNTVPQGRHATLSTRGTAN